MKPIYKRKVTRSVLSALQQNGLENILETASKTVDVIFVAKMCPQLEAQLSLLQPRPIAKRRHSTLLTGQRQKIKNRRHTCADQSSQEVHTRDQTTLSAHVSGQPDKTIAQKSGVLDNIFCEALHYSDSDNDEETTQEIELENDNPLNAPLHDECLECVHVANVKEVDTSMGKLSVDDNKENEKQQQQQQSSTTKKWYEGIVIKPVAFRALNRRRFSQN